MRSQTYDAVVIGGGPAGATAAADLATMGRSVLMLDRAGRIKPCGGAIPPRCIRDFDLPDHLLVAKAKAARIVAPSRRSVDMAIETGEVGLVDREVFDEWLRERAAALGADRTAGTFKRLDRDPDGTLRVVWQERNGTETSVRARHAIGADGANSAVARQMLPKSALPPFVFAYHEIIRVDGTVPADFDPARCDIHYDGALSPDFYAWIFPHGTTASIGTGSAHKGFALREAVGALRRRTGLDGAETLRREGAPLPLRPLKRWDNGRDVVVVGDAAGVVAPASGEGIYYAMATGRMAAEAVDVALQTGDARALGRVRRDFMRAHGRVFLILRLMQAVWYASDRRRERFVSICRDSDVQRLTWTAYLDKELGRLEFRTHLRIMMKDFGHLFGLVSPWGTVPSSVRTSTGAGATPGQ
jgi:geranylgeranyl reductase